VARYLEFRREYPGDEQSWSQGVGTLATSNPGIQALVLASLDLIRLSVSLIRLTVSLIRLRVCLIRLRATLIRLRVSVIRLRVRLGSWSP